MKTGRRTILVTGDVSIDWMLVTLGAPHAESVDTLWKVAGGFECRRRLLLHPPTKG